MKLLKAIDKEMLDMYATLTFKEDILSTSMLDLSILGLEKNGRSLFFDTIVYSSGKRWIELVFQYDESILSDDISHLADLKVQDLLLGVYASLNTLNPDGFIKPSEATLFVKGLDSELQIKLQIN
jgi:hypothetical protein